MPDDDAGVQPRRPPATVRLREVRDADLDAIFEQQRDPRSVAMAGVPARSRADFDLHWARIRASSACVLRVAEVDGAVAGTVVSFPLGGRRMAGYWIDRRFWGRGIATRALSLFLEELRERPLHATVLPANRASIRVLERCGFARESREGETLLYVLR